MNSTRQLFYRIIDSLSEDDLPLDAGDFRLVDRCVLNELRKFEDYQPYLRGTIAALGFEQIGIQRVERDRGQSKFSVKQLIGLALDGIFNHSVVPLRIATYLGLAISCATLLAIVGYLVGRLFLGKNWPPGFATIIALILGFLSLNALFLGIIGEYLGRIYRQVKRRPLTSSNARSTLSKRLRGRRPSPLCRWTSNGKLGLVGHLVRIPQRNSSRSRVRHRHHQSEKHLLNWEKKRNSWYAPVSSFRRSCFGRILVRYLKDVSVLGTLASAGPA